MNVGTPRGGFEGSFLGDDARIDAGSRMECGVCWWVYDPALGDEEWQIAPGTAFAALPDHWRCPNCDAAPSQFMALEDGVASREVSVDTTASLPPEFERLTGAYQQAAQRMQALPVFNDALAVTLIRGPSIAEGELCVVVTPWMMNLTLLPAAAAKRRREGTSRDLVFPSGSYPFIAGWLEGFGAIETCSLFSPMECFDDMAVATAVATQAMQGLFIAPATDAAPGSQSVAAPQTPGQTTPAPTRQRTSTNGLTRRQLLRPGAAR